MSDSWDFLLFYVIFTTTLQPPNDGKLQKKRVIYVIFSNIFGLLLHQHSKFTSKVQNLVEIEHFTVKDQLIASRYARSRQLGGVVNRFVGTATNFSAQCEVQHYSLMEKLQYAVKISLS